MGLGILGLFVGLGPLGFWAFKCLRLPGLSKSHFGSTQRHRELGPGLYSVRFEALGLLLQLSTFSISQIGLQYKAPRHPLLEGHGRDAILCRVYMETNLYMHMCLYMRFSYYRLAKHLNGHLPGVEGVALPLVPVVLWRFWL